MTYIDYSKVLRNIIIFGPFEGGMLSFPTIRKELPKLCEDFRPQIKNLNVNEMLINQYDDLKFVVFEAAE